MRAICMIFFLFAVALSSAGCKTTGDVLDSYLGKPIDRFIMKNGAPDRVYTLDDGRRVFEFERRSTETIYRRVPAEADREPSAYRTTGTIKQLPSLGSGSTYRIDTETRRSGIAFNTDLPQRRPVGTEIRECVMRFTVDRQGIVRHWSYTGHC